MSSSETESAPSAPASPGSAPVSISPPAPRLPEEPTVGTGSVFAIGCLIAMALVLAAGILYVLVIR